MSSCCRLHIHLPMDDLVPEGPGTAIGDRNEDEPPAKADENGSPLRQEVEEEGGGERMAGISEPTEEVKRPPSPEPAAEQVRVKHVTGRKPRTKGLVKKLQEQIEFYFGDANLSKDRFLLQKIKEHADGYVAVDVIASFKKMQSLTSDKALVLKAIQASQLVELSEDKLWLRRVAPLPSLSSADIDARTVYVENLSPTSTDHDAVRNMFKMFGKITYVSLPKYKVSGQIKGFAFIEFSTPEEANAALEYFTNKDKTTRSRKPSVAAKREEREDGKMETTTSEKGTEDGAVEPSTSSDGVAVMKEVGEDEEGASRKEEEGGTSRRGEKREREEEEEDGNQPSAKRPKSDPKEPVEERAGSVSEESSALKSRMESQSSEVDLDDTVDDGKDGPKKKRNRQHKKKPWASILRDLNLRVMSKNDWLEMKKVYHDLQKSHMKTLKLERGIGTAPGGDGVAEKKKGFVGNCLIKVACTSEEGADVKLLKEFCSKFGEVAYVDMQDKDKEGYIRFRQSGCVDAVVQSEGLKDVTFEGVQEDDERAYFLKSQAQRKQKFLKHGKNVRGRDKVISKALRNQVPAAATTAESAKPMAKKDSKSSSQKQTHIRFSDSDSEPDPSTT